jgi:tetratricopeptide (TPR) repeat protein
MEWLTAVLDLLKWLLEAFGVRRKDTEKGLAELRTAKQWLREARRAVNRYETERDESRDEMEYARDQARMAVRHAIRCGLPDLEEWLSAGSLAEELEEHVYAARAYQAVVRSKRTALAADACCRLAALSARQGQTEEAKSWLRKAFRLNPTHQEATRLQQQIATQTSEEGGWLIEETTTERRSEVDRHD